MKVLDQKEGNGWKAYHGDCVEVTRELPDSSVHFSTFSPPFASLYTYSPSSRDLGNCKTHSEFYEHFRFLVKELLRITIPGRLCAFHCMNLPTSKARDGIIGLTDFRGLLIRMFEEEGWILHSEVCIWKDPVQAMQRTKALGLLNKQLLKDAAMSRQSIPDYLIVMRKPGDNPEPVTHTGNDDEIPVQLWQRYASPVWAVIEPMPDQIERRNSDGSHRPPYIVPEIEKRMYDVKVDINPSETLQRESAREDADERHVCPTQLEVVRRAVKLWTNPGDIVFSPFGGIGTDGYVALQEGRKAVMVELKRSYFDQLTKNLASAEPNATGKQIDMFATATNSDTMNEAAE